MSRHQLLLLVFLAGGVTSQDMFYFTKHPAETTVAAGAPVALECEVSHGDRILSYWSLNDSRVLDSPRRHQEGRNLVITRADPVQDAGEYACIAENATTGYSLTSRTARLNVVWIGEATVSLVSPAEIRDGADLVLRCVVDGSEDLKYEWFRNGQALSRNERLQVRAGRGMLTVKQLTPSDNGVYTCAGINAAAVVRSSEGVVVRLRGEHTPNVSVLPRNLVVRRGDLARFDCAFEAADEVYWSFNDVRLQSNSRRTLHKNGSLVIPKVRPGDEGLYLCTGSRKRSDTLEYLEAYSANLTVAYLDDFTEASFEPPLSGPVLVTPLHARLDVTCLAPPGVPTPSVNWVDPRGRSLPGGALVLDTVREGDGGNYTCVVENLAVTKKFSVSVLIAVAPRPTRDARTISLDEGSPLTLPCPYQGSPPPATTFQWRRDGRHLGGHVAVSAVDGSLTLPSLQPADRGAYVCEVTTAGFPAAETAPTHVLVREHLKFAPRPVSKNLELGSQARIHCKAQGSPTPDVRWVKGSMGHAKPLPPHLSDINGTLLFRNASMADRGSYTCVATNEQGDIDATIDINVSVAPWFTVMPRNITEVQEGLPASIYCVAEGDPRPTITWDKDGSMDGLDRTRFQILDNGTLHVSAAYKADHGRYGCIAGNSGGFKRLETELVVRGTDDLEGELEEEESMMTRTVVITLSAAAGYMALVVGLMVWCRYRRRKRKQAYLNENPEGILLAKAENGEVKAEKAETEGKRLGVDERIGDGAEAAHSQSSGHSRRSGRTPNYDKIAFQRQNLRDLKLLGHGMFGQVLVGRAEPTKQLVVVKSLQNTRDESALAEFKRELDMFHRLAHEHVTRLVGLCRDTDPHYLILEYTDWGDLKQFLQSTKKERSKLSVGQLMELAKQVSLGMEHVSNGRYVHRDLAARNCLVTSDLQLKVTLLSLSRDLYSADYAPVRNQTIPLRWLPAEAVFEDDYSTKSDVYSFAVLCWELFHQGDRPFANLTDDQVVERLERRELVVRPSKHAPAAASTLFAACASASPKDRPTFSSIAIALTEVLADL